MGKPEGKAEGEGEAKAEGEGEGDAEGDAEEESGGAEEVGGEEMGMMRWDTGWILKSNGGASRLGGLLLARQVSFCLEVLFWIFCCMFLKILSIHLAIHPTQRYLAIVIAQSDMM